MFYTLPGVTKFDSNGLWCFRDVFFSIHGNLKQTAIRLVQQSSRGLDGQEVSALVGLPPGSSYLSRLRDIPGISREWRNGRWVYLSGEDGVVVKDLAIYPQGDAFGEKLG